MGEVFLDALLDSLKVLAVLVACNIIIALIEPKISKNVKLKGKLATLIGVSVGLLPQCGFSVVATDLYQKRHITVGTLIGVYIATSDEAIPIFLSDPSKALHLLPLLALKFALGLLFGYLVDFIYVRWINKNGNEITEHKHGIKITECGCGSGCLMDKVSKHSVSDSQIAIVDNKNDISNEIKNDSADTADSKDVKRAEVTVGSGEKYGEKSDCQNLGSEDENNRTDGENNSCTCACGHHIKTFFHPEAEGKIEENKTADTKPDGVENDVNLLCACEYRHHKSEEAKLSAEEAKKIRIKNKLDKFLWHPILHSLRIFVYIFIVNVLFGIVIYFVGEDKFVEFLSANKYIAPLFAVIVGAVPNCVSSVVLSELYIMGGLGFGATLAGLTMNAGLGFMVLFKKTKQWKGNLAIFALMFAISILVGYVFSAIFNFDVLQF
jgi:hypothetical protein